MSVEKKPVSYYLKTVGVLTAIGVGSALLITSLNLLTGPIIQQRKDQAATEAYEKIFPGLTSVSDATTVEGRTYVTEYRSAFQNDNELGKLISVSGKNSRATYDFLVGFSGDGDEPLLNGVSFVTKEMTKGYDTTFDAYLNAFLENPTDANLNATKTGATISCSLFCDMYKDARDFYATISGGVSEDYAAEIQALYGDTYFFKATNADVAVEDGTYLRKYYSLYDADDYLNEVGRLYSLRASEEGGKIGFAVGITGDSVVSVNSYIYQNTLDGGATGVVPTPEEGENSIFRAMVDEALDHYETHPLDTLVSLSSHIFDNFDSASEPEDITGLTLNTSAVIIKGEIPCSNTGIGSVLKHWTAYDADDKEIGEVYLCNLHISFTDRDHYLEAHGDAMYIVGFTYESETVCYGKMYVISDTMSRGADWETNYVAGYNQNPGSELDPDCYTNATISGCAADQTTALAASHYSSMKKGA